jgi:hypothetical protein
MITDTATPPADTPAEASGQPEPADQLDTSTQTEATGQEGDEPAEGDQPKKPEKTPEQRELDRARRKIDRLTKQKYELLNQVQNRAVQGQSPGAESGASDHDDVVTLSRSDLERQIRAEAEKLAPTLQQQRTVEEQRRTVVEKLAQTWGQERFDEVAADLDDALGGLADASGKPKPATEAIFEAEDPAALIEYLADPDNAEHANRIASMTGVKAGIEIAKLEAKLAAKREDAKPKRSQVPPPIEGVRGQGTPSQAVPTDTKAYMKWADAKYGRI